MARSEKSRHSRRSFFILVVVVVLSGVLLWSQGDLRSPLQSTAMLIGLSAGEDGFAMVGEERRPPDMTARTTSAETNSAAPETASGTMTLETLTAELAAAGVDMEALSATMAAEGRSLENLLSVVNSGRVTVAELAARLNGDSTTIAAPPAEGSAALLDIRWEELGSVAYNLWFMLAATVIVIVIARPVGWLVNRLKRAQPASAV